MPYSISALFALPRSLAGLFFASKVVHLSSPSPPVVKYTPTRTTHIFFEPTRCLPSPTSSEPSELPYVVLYGFAIVIIASVVFTIWSTIKDARRRSPPPEPDPETKPDKFGTWTPWLVVLSLNIAFYLSSTVTVIPAPPKSLFPELMLYRLAMMLEGKILDILSIVHHLHTHGLQYLKIVMLAIAGHAIGLLTTLAHRRVLAFVHQHHLRILSFIRKHWGPVLAALVFGLLHVLQSPRHYGYSPDRWQIPRNFVLSLPSVQLGMVSMILAPLIIHCAAISLYTVITSLCFLPSTVRAVVPDRKMYRLLSAYILASIALFLTAYNLLSFAHLEAIPVGPDASYWIRDRGSQIFTSAQPRREIWESSRSSRGHHSNWVGFYEFIRLLWATAWEALPWAQKLLIVVPTVLFYGYFYIMPVMMPRVRKIQVLLRMEYQKYRRRQAVYRRYLQESV